MRWLAVCCLCACGRVGFDEHTADSRVAAFSLVYPGTIFAVIGTTNLAIPPTVTGTTDALTYTASAALPAGITLDPSSGTITGTPAAVFSATVTISATGPTGSATCPIIFRTLPGYEVGVTPDLADDDGGTDTTCFTSSAGGCTLRGALQTVLAHTTADAQLILLADGTYPLASTLPPLQGPIVIAGGSRTGTVIAAATMRDFGPSDGAVIHATAGMVLLENSLFANNTSNNSGGVVFASGATVTLRRSAFVGNSVLAGNGWGGVVDGEGANTVIDVEASFAAMNTAVWGSFSHVTTGTTIGIIDSTFTANTSTIAGTFATPGGTYTLVNDTVAFNTNTNTTPNSAGIYLFMAPAHYDVENTIVAFNTDITGQPANCNRRDLMTTLTSNGGNIISDGAGNCGMYFTATEDRLSTDPGLDPAGAQFNGDSLKSFALVPGSVAIDTGVAKDCPMTDQRGLPRNPQACDVGAYEVQN